MTVLVNISFGFHLFSLKDIEAITRSSRFNTAEWHTISSYPQALDTLRHIGEVLDKPAKVKVQPGESASCERIPLNFKPSLTLETTEQRRDYAHFVLYSRQMDVHRRHKKAVRDVFFPYVKGEHETAKGKLPAGP